MRLNLKLIVAAGAAIMAAGCVSAPESSNLTGDYLSGRFAARINAVDAAAAAYAKAHADAPQQVVLLKQAFFFHLAAGDIDAAVPYARDILDMAAEEDDGLATATLAAQALKSGRLKEARTLFDNDMRAPFIQSVAFLSNVWIERGLTGPEAALDMLDAPGADVFTGFNPLHKAFLAEQAGRRDDAREAYQAALFSPGGPIAHAAYGAFLERAGEGDAAQDFYGLLAQDPGPGRRIASQAMTRLGRGGATKAFASVSPAEGSAIAFYSFGDALIKQAAGQRMRAADAGFEIGDPHYNLPLAMARLALYLDPKLVEARRLVGQILNIYGDYPSARAVLSEVPASSPYYEQTQIDIAGGLSAGGAPDEAITLLKAASRRDPGADELKWTLSNYYAADGRQEDAVAVLDKVIGGLGDAPDAGAWRYYMSRGASQLELGNWEEAEADLARAVELAPEEPTALNYLGYSWAERGVNLDRAFELIEKAVALEPNSGAIVDSLGWAHYQLGDYEEAVGHLEKAAALEPSDATITDHLGDVYWRLGREIEARFQWRRVLDLEPGDKVRTAVLRKLDAGLGAAPPAPSKPPANQGSTQDPMPEAASDLQ